MLKKLAALSTLLMCLAGGAAFADGQAEAAEKLVHDYINTVVIGREFDRIDEFVAEDVIQHNPNLPDGRAPLRQFWTGFMGSMPDAELTIVRSISDGTYVWKHTLFQRSADDPGVAVVDIYRVADGQIVEHWDVLQDVVVETASGNHMVLENSTN